MNPLDILSFILISTGLFFFIAGAVGIIRFPDLHSRLHAITKADNLGLGLLVLGLLPQVSTLFAFIQLVLIWLVVLVCSATCSSLLARHARNSLTALEQKRVTPE